jgi:hypothetical protein
MVFLGRVEVADIEGSDVRSEGRYNGETCGNAESVSVAAAQKCAARESITQVTDST